jgi:hypothetical protein
MSEAGSLILAAKDPKKVRAGQIGARTRWGPEPRVVRLDELTAAQRRLVLALVSAARKEAVTVSETSVTAQEARRVGDEPSAA